MRKKTLYGSLCLLCSLLLIACSSDIVYSKIAPISSDNWHCDSAACFDYTITDTDATYNVLIYVRHTERYPYQNMWLFVSDNTRNDTIEFYLADDRGQWLGDKKHGFMEMPVLFEENLHYQDSGTYHMTIRHGMRDTLLRGITDVGVEIRKANGQE